MNLKKIFDSEIGTREIHPSMFHRNESFESFDGRFIGYIEEHTGLKFKKSYNSNSYYSGDIRISDHPCKGNYECYYFSMPPEYIVMKIKGQNPFSSFKKGDMIRHDAESVGNCEFVSYDKDKEKVNVLFSDGTEHSIFEEKFANSFNF